MGALLPYGAENHSGQAHGLTVHYPYGISQAKRADLCVRPFISAPCITIETPYLQDIDTIATVRLL